MNEEKGINEYNKKVIDDLNKKINQKDEELIRLKEYLIDMKNKLNSQKKAIKINEIINVNISSSDGIINHSIPCIGSDIFAEIEEKLYRKYPKYRETNNVFLYNGNSIRRFKTIEDNKIKSGDLIILNTFEENN